MPPSLSSVLKSSKLDAQKIVDALPTGVDGAVSAIRKIIPYLSQHPNVTAWSDGDTLAGVLLRIHDVLYNKEEPDYQLGSITSMLLEQILADANTNQITEDVIELLLEWKQARHKPILMTILHDLMQTVFPQTNILDSPKGRELYKQLYRMVLKHRSMSPDDRSTMLAYLYEANDWDPEVALLVRSCLRKDKSLMGEDSIRRYFFIDILRGMDKVHPCLLRLMKTGDADAVHHYYLNKVMEIMSKKRKRRRDWQELAQLRPVLTWTFVPKPRGHSGDVERTIAERNRQFVHEMSTVLDSIRGELRTRVGVPANLPNFEQLRTIVRKRVIRDPELGARMLSEIDNLQAQIQRHRLG